MESEKTETDEIKELGNFLMAILEEHRKVLEAAGQPTAGHCVCASGKAAVRALVQLAIRDGSEPE